MMKPSSSSCVVCLLLLGPLLLVAASAVIVTPTETATWAKWRSSPRPAATMPDEDFLAQLCDQQREHLLPWCKQLHARRVGGGTRVATRPPGKDGEEIDVRYGVSKRLVPSGPNLLHN